VLSTPKNTGFDRPTLDTIANQLFTIPTSFDAHKTVKQIIETRLTNYKNGNVDWSTAEALAFATLMQEGQRVRLSGQDVKRGTFSQRHAVIWDQTTGNELNNFHGINPDSKRSTLSIVNSLLSE